MNQSLATPFDFEDATREKILLKMAISGPPGSGKSLSAIKIASYLSKALDLGELYVIDSENRSSLKYAYNQRTGKGYNFKALHLPKDNYSPDTYMRALDVAEKRGAKILIIDSISHAWNGVKGILEMIDDLTDASRSKNAFSEGWKKATPLQRRFIQAILAHPAHIIATMRADPDWVVQENDRGKKEPTMIGLAPQQRKDISYEFDIAMTIDRDHTARVEKGRCEELNEAGAKWPMPGENVGRILEEWIRTSDVMTPEKEKDLAAALDVAVRDGVEAAKQQNQEGYKAVRGSLRLRCEGLGIPAARRDQALKDFLTRVTAARKPVQAAPANDALPVKSLAERRPNNDEEALRAIYEGRA